MPDSVLVVLEDFRFNKHENKWATRDFHEEFPLLLKLLIKHELARPETFGTYAQNKNRIHLNTKWADLQRALRVESEDTRIIAFVEEARHLFSKLR